MSQYNIIAESAEYTVVSEYERAVQSSDAYQSEADLEKEFIHLLCEQGYEHLPIHTETDLTAGLPAEIEKRKLQYEYYRDKLLTFKRKNA